MSGNYDLDQLVAAALDSAVANLHVALPGIVKSYDAATRTATVQPAVRKPVLDEDEAISFEEFPPIPNVPVVFPGAAAMTVYFALAAGDVVSLVWQDYSPAQWRKTGKVSDAGDAHAHGPSYPVAFPWYRPSDAPADATDESIGKPGGLRLHFGDSAVGVGGQSDFVAMAAKTDARLTALESFAAQQATFDSTHTHPVPGVTPGVGSVVASPAAAPPPTPPSGASVASTNLKAD